MLQAAGAAEAGGLKREAKRFKEKDATDLHGWTRIKYEGNSGFYPVFSHQTCKKKRKRFIPPP